MAKRSTKARATIRKVARTAAAAPADERHFEEHQAREAAKETPPAPVVACSACRLWQRLPLPTNEVGQCRRYPPTGGTQAHHRNIEGFSIESAWPITDDVMWCGEFAPAP